MSEREAPVRSAQAVCVLCGEGIEGATALVEVPSIYDAAAAAGQLAEAISPGWFTHPACLKKVAVPHMVEDL